MKSLFRFYILLLLSALFPLLIVAQVKKKIHDTNPKPDVIIHTKLGDIWIVLYDATPLHKDNFLKLASQRFYDSTTFHRVIKNFMIQGGDPFTRIPSKQDSIGDGGPGYMLPAELLDSIFHRRGVLAAARLGDDINPDRLSSGSQFYIVTGRVFTEQELKIMEAKIAAKIPGFTFTEEQKNAYTSIGGAPWLDRQYTVFGEVMKGMEVVDAISVVLTDPKNNRPVSDLKMWMELGVKYKPRHSRKHG